MTEGYGRMTTYGRDAEAASLTRPSRDELLFSIEHSMRYDARGKATNAARDVAIRLLAERVLEHLERSNYVVMKGPPMKSWSTPEKPSIPSKD